MYHISNVLIHIYVNIIEEMAKIFEFFYSIKKATAIRIVDRYLWVNDHVPSVGGKSKKQTKFVGISNLKVNKGKLKMSSK